MMCEIVVLKLIANCRWNLSRFLVEGWCCGEAWVLHLVYSVYHVAQLAAVQRSDNEHHSEVLRLS
jgi:hypothetical protein